MNKNYTIDPLLELFLIVTGNFDAFTTNMIEYNFENKDVTRLTHAFKWDLTPEGSDYWNALDDLHQQYER